MDKVIFISEAIKWRGFWFVWNEECIRGSKHVLQNFKLSFVGRKEKTGMPVPLLGKNGLPSREDFPHFIYYIW